jgi:hypothetical protein
MNDGITADKLQQLRDVLTSLESQPPVWRVTAHVHFDRNTVGVSYDGNCWYLNGEDFAAIFGEATADHFTGWTVTQFEAALANNGICIIRD